MGISMFLTGTSFGIKISQVVLQAAATGSLMYVAFIEVLAKRTGIKQLAVVILGFLLMALLQICKYEKEGERGREIERERERKSNWSKRDS